MNVILGITGSISAYKTPWLVRDLRRAGHDVHVVMTPSAREFVAPLALEATSLHPVIIDPYDASIQDRGSWHVHLARWADVMLIAPCSATTLARLANAMCDTALMTVACSLPVGTPLIVAPAMDTDMWDHPATRRNVDRIAHDGAIIIPPVSGPLASGLSGAGRLPESNTYRPNTLGWRRRRRPCGAYTGRPTRGDHRRTDARGDRRCTLHRQPLVRTYGHCPGRSGA
jgi:phosphopantothenoylcysteine decarboxylase/phosphopantothenate--cysteine ligase